MKEESNPREGAACCAPTYRYKDSGVEWLGKVPEHWEVLALKRISCFAYGDSLPEEKRQEGKVPVFGSSGVVGSHSEGNTRAPCIVVGRKGSFGKVTFSNVAGFAIDTTYFVDSTQTQQDLRWMFYLLSSLNLSDVSQDTGVPGLSRENAYNRKVTLPPLSEQRAIASYLDRETARLDTLVSRQERLIELLQEKRRALIGQAVTRGLDETAPRKDSGVEWLGKVPEHWEVKRLKYFSRIVSGSTPRSNVPEFWDGDILWATPEDIGKLRTAYLQETKRQITQEGYASCGTELISAGSIILTTRAPIGNLAIAADPMCTNQGCKSLVPGERVLSKYLYYRLLTLIEVLQSYGRGSTFLELSTSDLSAFKIPVPPIPEQRAIVEYLDAETAKIDRLIEKARRAIDLMREHRSALIASVVTGQIDVRGL